MRGSLCAGSIAMPACGATVKSAMSSLSAVGASRWLRYAIAVMAAVWLLGILDACLFPQLEPPHSHASSVLTTGAGDVVVSAVADHTGTNTDSCFVVPQAWLMTGLIALGVALAAAAIFGWFTWPVVLALRGPPRYFAATRTGQDILTRLCIARR